MRLATALVVLLPALARTLAVESPLGNVETRDFNQTALKVLPSCAAGCVDQVATSAHCKASNTACFCSANITAAFQTCLASNCKIPLDILSGQKYQAQTCNYPVRSKQTLHRTVTWVMFTLSTLFTSFRVASRMSQLEGPGFSWDDYVLFFSYLLALLADVATETTLHYGSAMDEYWLTAHQIKLYTMWTYVSEILYNTIIITTKIAVVLLYLRVWSADMITQAFRTTSWVIIGVLILTGIAFDFGLIFQCVPVSYNFTLIEGTQGKCINLAGLTYTFGALNVCYDVLIFFLPIHSLLKLNIAWQKKVGVCAVFLTGFVVTVCGIVRLQYLVRFNSKQNPTWVFQPISMWSVIELNLSIVCCCMPATAGLCQRFWRWYTGKPLTISTGAVSNQTTLTANSSQQDEKSYKCHTDLPSCEEGLALGEIDGRAKKESEGPGQVEEGESEYGRSATELLKSQNARAPRRWNINRTALVHQARSGRERSDTVEIGHVPPQEASEARLEYRDADDVVHRVRVIDEPEGKIPGPMGRKGSHE